MESKYKEILLLTGLDGITDEELDRFKFFLPDEFDIPKGKLKTAPRTELANLMIQNAGVVSAVTKTIHIFQRLKYMHVAKRLQEEKEKVDKCECEKETMTVKKRSQATRRPGASAAARNDSRVPLAALGVPPRSKSQQKQMVAEQDSPREGLQKGGLIVMVLKAMNPFEFKTQEGKQEMFHATVATEKEFFLVKVFNTQLKDNFTPKRTIIISNYYYRHNGILEVNSASRVFDAKPNQEVTVPKSIIRKAGQTLKINKLQTQPLGTIVNGIYVVQKKTEQKNSVLFDLSDNTGRMEVLVPGKQNKIECEEGDKLRLTFLELARNGEKLQLKFGAHSDIKVIKTKKKK
ncbi:interferon-inducible protein AIM2 [Tupaia chinensis]|uniref:interferon-inducible protein AIM2 n=1 Tax=Tupaia chinensis TaxID=246437 RepID=UPI000703F1B9|nr:interferon-inducible protein AIM2 [Tupaia chinensis]XP_014439778.1 interferon-inducible protein AIM2 [Tupaia chinensis]XP_027624231.1 interferon-inducible protein AIM2 [Tupaia chinensis]